MSSKKKEKKSWSEKQDVHPEIVNLDIYLVSSSVCTTGKRHPIPPLQPGTSKTWSVELKTLLILKELAFSKHFFSQQVK